MTKSETKKPLPASPDEIQAAIDELPGKDDFNNHVGHESADYLYVYGDTIRAALVRAGEDPSVFDQSALSEAKAAGASPLNGESHASLLRDRAGVPRKLYLWKNSDEEYWAFNGLYPRSATGDPVVLGEPCGYAIYKDAFYPDTAPKPVTPSHDLNGEWQLVPKEPTDEMLEAAHDAARDKPWGMKIYSVEYKAMLSAAPKIFTTETKE